MATLRDVAAAAGVSAATASRALSAPGSVSRARREQVMRAAEELGYRPNPSARALARGRSGHLGLVLPDLANPFFAAIAKGVQARARETGRAVLIADADEDGTLEFDLVRDLQPSVEAVVLCSPRMSPQRLAACAAAGPIVLVNREHPELPSVSFDTPDGVRQTLAHLRALGHRRVAYIGGPETSWSDAERRGALDRLPDVDVVEVASVRPVHSGGVAAADLALATDATAVLCFNDLVALGALTRLQTRGVRVPQEVSVVGFDDIPSATLARPALTTVSVPLTRAGREAVDLVAPGGTAPGGGAPGGPPDGPPAHLRLPVELLVRDSTAPAPATSAHDSDPITHPAVKEPA